MKLCVSVAEPTVEAACAAILRTVAGGAFAEVRLDAFDGCETLTVEDLEPLVDAAKETELLFTFRRPCDGGRREVDDRTRLSLLAEAARRFNAMCDVEHECASDARALGVPAGRTVLSHHDFEATPSDLVALFERMAETPAAVYKIATRVDRVEEIGSHFAVLARSRELDRRVVAIAMGEKGIATRVLGPAWGSEFTFCAPDDGGAVAPGQLSLGTMRDLYRADRIGPQTVVTGLVAGNVGYSRSPAMHNRAAAELGLDLVYVPFAVDDVRSFVDAFAGGERQVPWNLRGLSVTNPFKTDVIDRLDWLDPLAERTGAVNTVVIEDGGRLAGYNTDVAGAMEPLVAVAGPLSGLRVGVLGAGGAARAVLCGLVDRGARATVFARNVDRARAVAEAFGAEVAPVGEVGASDLDVLVNATPAGTSGVADGVSPVPGESLRHVRIVYDLVYAPERTPLLVDAERAGCRTLGGLPMLATQAALQFELWTGARVSPERMVEFARG